MTDVERTLAGLCVVDECDEIPVEMRDGCGLMVLLCAEHVKAWDAQGYD